MESDQQRFGYNDSNKFGPVSQELVEVGESWPDSSSGERWPDSSSAILHLPQAKVTFLLGTPVSPWEDCLKNIESVLPESAQKRLKVAGQAQ